MTNQLTVLFAPMKGVGHVMACIGLAEVLHSRGHEIVFLVTSSYKGKLSPYGFIEEFLVSSVNENNNNKPGQTGGENLMKSGSLENKTSLQSVKIQSAGNWFERMIDEMIAMEPQVKQVVDKYKPDVYVIDHFVGSPSLIFSDKPWVFLWSGNTLFILHDEKTPPGGSGFPSNGDKNSKEWKEFRELFENLHIKDNHKYNEYLKENGFPTVDNKQCIPGNTTGGG